MDHYETLGVQKNATQDEIKKAFRKLSLLYHPDKHPESEDKFKDVNEAYQVLSDVAKRKQYDVLRNNPFFGGGSQVGLDDILNDEHIGEMLKQMFGATTSNMRQPQMRSGMGNMPSFMSSLFGMPSFTTTTSSRGAPNIRIFNGNIPTPVDVYTDDRDDPNIEVESINKNIHISFKQAYDGCTLPITIERTIYHHTTRLKESETLYIDIPPGIDDDEIIEIRDKGHNYPRNIKSSLKIKVIIDKNEHFRREGLNILYNKQITLKEALCGFVFGLTFINGRTYNISNPKGNILYPGYTKEIPNMGFKRKEVTGKLCIIFSVQFPDKLTSDQYTTLENGLP